MEICSDLQKPLTARAWPLAACRPLGGRSNIDFLLMRKPQSDRISHDAKCLTQFPVSAHRDYPDHRPLVGTIPDGRCGFTETRKHPPAFLAAMPDV